MNTLTESQFSDFAKNEWYDKNLPTDTFDTFHFVEYRKPISNGFNLLSTFTYLAEQKGKFEPYSAPVLEIECPDGETFEITPNLEKALGFLFNTNNKSNPKEL